MSLGFAQQINWASSKVTFASYWQLKELSEVLSNSTAAACKSDFIDVSMEPAVLCKCIFAKIVVHLHLFLFQSSIPASSKTSFHRDF
jgi:hypothetical protein